MSEGYSPVVECGPLTVGASLAAECRLALVVAAHGLSSCGTQARGRWNLPRLGIEPMFPALAGRVPSTPPPGKSKISLFFKA